DIGKEAFHFAERFISGLATDVELIEAPSEVALMQAYPNPLRAGHHFTLDVPTTGLVLMVDMLGRTVRVLEVDRGRHVVDTDGLAPGIYLLRAEGSTVSLILTR
ncbi:MAG: T9SS type A sorting domain-containing protein, partial [Bacteroidetes bacterium]|nr:T9SS type A sorting domain-containing protein [Bacteroidota bacterium]